MAVLARVADQRAPPSRPATTAAMKPSVTRRPDRPDGGKVPRAGPSSRTSRHHDHPRQVRSATPRRATTSGAPIEHHELAPIRIVRGVVGAEERGVPPHCPAPLRSGRSARCRPTSAPASGGRVSPGTNPRGGRGGDERAPSPLRSPASRLCRTCAIRRKSPTVELLAAQGRRPRRRLEAGDRIRRRAQGRGPGAASCGAAGTPHR